MGKRELKLDYLKTRIQTLNEEDVSLEEVLNFTGELLEFTVQLVADIQSINQDLKRIEDDQQKLKKEKEEVSQLLEYLASLSGEKPQKALEILESIQKQVSKNKLIN